MKNVPNAITDSEIRDKFESFDKCVIVERIKNPVSNMPYGPAIITFSEENKAAHVLKDIEYNSFNFILIINF